MEILGQFRWDLHVREFISTSWNLVKIPGKSDAKTGNRKSNCTAWAVCAAVRQNYSSDLFDYTEQFRHFNIIYF